MARVLAGVVTTVDEASIVFGKYTVSRAALTKIAVGDHVVMTIDSYKPEVAPVKQPKRKFDPMLEKGKPSIPGAK